MVRRSTPAESHGGLNLIPASGVGEAVGGVTEAVRDDKTGGNRVEGTFSNDTTCDEMTSGHKNKSSSP